MKKESKKIVYMGDYVYNDDSMYDDHDYILSGADNARYQESDDDEELEEPDEFFREGGDDSAAWKYAATAALVRPEDAQKLRESGQESKIRFQRYADIVNDKSLPNEEHQKVEEDACKRLEGYIIQTINVKFHAYIEQDPSFRDDLITAAQHGIIANMGKYDMAKGQPLTFFARPIIQEMVCATNSMKNNTKSYITSIKKDIMEVYDVFQRQGLPAPTPEDYYYYLGRIKNKDGSPKYTRSRIKNALVVVRNQRSVVSMDSLPPTAVQSVSDLSGRRPGSAEVIAIQNINAQNILERIKATTPNEQHVNIFLAYAGYSCSTSAVAREMDLPEEYVKSVVQEMKKKLSNDEVIAKTYPEYAEDNCRDVVRPITGIGTGIIVQGRMLKLAIS